MKPKEFKGKKSKTKTYWAVLIILIMVSSSIGFVYNFIKDDSDIRNKIEYNGFTFFRSQNGWITSYNGQQFELNYLPTELNDVRINMIDLADKVYLAYNASNYNQLILFNLQRISYILGLNDIRGVLACIDKENCPDIPIVDCNNENKIVYFKKVSGLNNTFISNVDSCVIIEASDDINFNKATDKIIYDIMGIK